MSFLYVLKKLSFHCGCTLCFSPGYCCQQWPGPGPYDPLLCSCAVDERCPCRPSVWNAVDPSHGTPYCRTHLDQYGSLSILPVWSVGQNCCSQRHWLVIVCVNSLPLFSVKFFKKKDIWSSTFGLTIRLIKARRKRRTMMQTAMFPFRPLSPVLWRRSSSIGIYPALKLLLCSLLIPRLSKAFSLMDFFTGPLELSWNRRSFVWHNTTIYENLIMAVRRNIRDQ